MRSYAEYLAEVCMDFAKADEYFGKAVDLGRTDAAAGCVGALAHYLAKYATMKDEDLEEHEEVCAATAAAAEAEAEGGCATSRTCLAHRRRSACTARRWRWILRSRWHWGTMQHSCTA